MAKSTRWKTLILILLASSYALTGTSFCYYRWMNKSGIDGPGLDESTISNFNKMINALDVQVSNLDVLSSQLQMNTPSGQIQTAGSVGQQSKLLFAQEVFSLRQAQLTLQLERERLQASLGQSQTANTSGLFLYASGASSYVIVGGVYANRGVAAAVSVDVTFTFYSQPGGLGTVLCAATRQLGNVSGQTVLSIGVVVCGSRATKATSVVFEFKWSL